ncbi:MAG: hypothetical protein LBJ92_01140 [Holosporales bacterium]|nr:hypothetical protein [Holosporales bacterium]
MNTLKYRNKILMALIIAIQLLSDQPINASQQSLVAPEDDMIMQVVDEFTDLVGDNEASALKVSVLPIQKAPWSSLASKILKTRTVASYRDILYVSGTVADSQSTDDSPVQRFSSKLLEGLKTQLQSGFQFFTLKKIKQDLAAILTRNTQALVSAYRQDPERRQYLEPFLLHNVVQSAEKRMAEQMRAHARESERLAQEMENYKHEVGLALKNARLAEERKLIRQRAFAAEGRDRLTGYRAHTQGEAARPQARHIREEPVLERKRRIAEADRNRLLSMVEVVPGSQSSRIGDYSLNYYSAGQLIGFVEEKSNEGIRAQLITDLNGNKLLRLVRK